MAKPGYYKEDLEQMVSKGCSKPGCDCKDERMYIRSRCHPEGPVQVAYDPVTKLVHIECRTCDRPIMEIVPAPTPGLGSA